MLPRALAAAAHHEQVAVAKVAAEPRAAAALAEQQGARRAQGDDRDHGVLRPPAPDRVAMPGNAVAAVAVQAQTRSAERLAELRAEMRAPCRPRRSARPNMSQPTPPTIGRCPDMTNGHSSYDDLARERRESPEYREGYAEAQRAFLIRQAVRERRLAFGLSQTELATQAGMTQPALSRLEAGGVIPTIPLLERISAALDADLIVQISPHAA